MAQLNVHDIPLSFETSPPKQRIRKQGKHEKEHSDDVVIKGRDSPVKGKVKTIKRKRQLSDEFTELKPVPVWSISEIHPPPQRKDKQHYHQLEMKPIKPHVRHMKVMKESHRSRPELPLVKYGKSVEVMREQRLHDLPIHYGTHVEMMNQKDRLKQELQREMMVEEFAAESERKMYKDRNDERQYQLAKMRIEHIEPLTRANIQSRQQLLLEQNAALQRQMIRREHNHYLIKLYHAYRQLSQREKIDKILSEFRIDSENYDDTYISEPTQESYMIYKKNYTYSILCLGVKAITWNEANDEIIIEFINDTVRRIPMNGQLVRFERFGTTVVIRFSRFVQMMERPKGKCPRCPSCDIS